MSQLSRPGIPHHKTRSFSTEAFIPQTTQIRLSDGLTIHWGPEGEELTSTQDETIGWNSSRVRYPNSAKRCTHLVERSHWPYEGPVAITTPRVNPTDVLHYTGYLTHEKNGLGYAKSAARAAYGVNLREAGLGDGLALIAQGYDRMRPDLTEVSVPNFLWELEDIKSLYKIWNSRRGLIPNVAGAYLNLNFGWLPTVGDVSNMIESIVLLHKNLRDWRKSLGRVISRRCTLASDTFSPSGTLADIPFSHGSTLWKAELKRKITAHIVYKPLPIKGLSDLEILLRGYLDGFGFELNPGIIWEAVPFSFVVDWFVNIGAYLNRFKFDSLELPIQLVDSYLQYKEEEIVTATVYDDDPSNSPHWLPTATFTGKFFRRILVSPLSHDLRTLGWKTPNAKQTVLGLALILSRGSSGGVRGT